MTTIVFDGRLLASDSLLVEDDAADIGPAVPKFYTRGGLLIAWAGAMVWHERIADYALARRSKGGRMPYPVETSAEGEAAIWDGVRWRRYFSQFEGNEQPPGAWCMGRGAPYARAALVMGADAVEAVRVAAQLDIYTGGTIFSVDVSTLNLEVGLKAVTAHEIDRRTGPPVRKRDEVQPVPRGRNIASVRPDRPHKAVVRSDGRANDHLPRVGQARR